MSTQTDAPALVRDLRQAARRRDALADAYARRAEKYRSEAAEMRAAAAQVLRRVKRSKAAPDGPAVTPRASSRDDRGPRAALPLLPPHLRGENGK